MNIRGLPRLSTYETVLFLYSFFSVAENKEQCFFTGTHLNKKLWRRNKNGMVKSNIGKGED